MHRVIRSLSILIILLTACTPAPKPSPTQTVAPTVTVLPTPTPTPIPLPLGSASGEQTIATTEIRKEVPVESVVLLKPIEELAILQSISIHLDALQNDFPDLTDWQILAAVDANINQEFRYSLVIKAQHLEQTVLVLATTISVDGKETPTTTPAFFEENETGALQVKTSGINYTLSAVNDQEELGIYWQEDQPLLVRAPWEEVFAQVWHAGEWQISDRMTDMTWDGTNWERIIPPLPDWAQEYVAFHQGQLETINGIDYYITQKTVQVGEETRQIAVKMMEYDQKAQEWIPCYDTVQELLDTRKLGSLHELNNITAPDEAVWIVRETWPESKDDLQKLEAMFHEFGVQIEEEVGHAAFWPVSTLAKPGKTFLLKPRCLSLNCELFQSAVDGLNLNEPKSWISLKYGNNIQVVIGMMLFDRPGLVWLGLDQSGFALTDERKLAEIRTTFGDAISYVINHDGLYKDLGFGFETTDFLGATPESTAAWADVLDYYAQLPADEQNFQYDAEAIWTPFGRENPVWIEFMSGKINWLSSGMYAIEKE